MNKQEDSIDPSHRQPRSILRIVGLAVFVTGLVFTIVGVVSFLSSFGSFSMEPPRYFWCSFVGIPLVMLGIVICQFAFMGAVFRYVANETAPVGKDTFNYTVAGTKNSVRDLATAVGEGLRSGMQTQEVAVQRCPKCNGENQPAANFCNQCGTPLR